MVVLNNLQAAQRSAAQKEKASVQRAKVNSGIAPGVGPPPAAADAPAPSRQSAQVSVWWVITVVIQFIAPLIRTSPLPQFFSRLISVPSLIQFVSRLIHTAALPRLPPL